MPTIENAIIVRGKTRLEQLTSVFNTRQQAEFYIEQNIVQTMSKSIGLGEAKKKAKQRIVDVQEESERYHENLDELQVQLNGLLKCKEIDRSYLPNYIFSEKDVVIVYGQDGLVANTAKYVGNIPIVAVNPDPSRFDGVLLPFAIHTMKAAVMNVISGSFRAKEVTMAEARLNDGQRLLAFNDLFIGPSTHTSARYQITHQKRSEFHSSSGLIVSTGAGSTGWMSSVMNMAKGISRVFGNEEISINQKITWDTDRLIFAVREPFQSKTSQIELSAGIIDAHNELVLESHMASNGVIFSDGIESDFLKFNSGSIATIGVASEKARLVY
ncbi:MAG: sugar kinase [Cytophagaceae bacterium]|jgi:NAD kinase|nr:sugar kinase [Cytophagaceae bacterium]